MTRNKKIKNILKKSFTKDLVDVESLIDSSNMFGIQRSHDLYCLKHGNCYYNEFKQNFETVSESWIYFTNKAYVKLYFEQVIADRKHSILKKMKEDGSFLMCNHSPNTERCNMLLKKWVSCESADSITVYDYTDPARMIIAQDLSNQDFPFAYVHRIQEEPAIFVIEC